MLQNLHLTFVLCSASRVKISQHLVALLLSYVVPVKSKVKISQNFVAFSEYMNFMITYVYGTNQKVFNNLDPTNEKVTETGAINSPDFSSRNVYSS